MTDAEYELGRAISEMSFGQLERFMGGLKTSAPMAICTAATKRLYEIALYDNHVPVADRKAAREWLGTVKAIVEVGYRERPEAVTAYRAANEHMEDGARLIGVGTLPWLITEHGVEGTDALIEFVMRPEHEPLLEDFYLALGDGGKHLREEVERRKREAAPAPPKMTKVEFVGSFMLIQFYDGHHWQMSDETLDRYADLAGPELRDLMRFWALMYLAYLFRWCIFGVYGAEFEKAMMASFYDRMQLVTVKPGQFDIAATIKYWFGHLDLATTAAAEKRTVGEYKDVELPATYFAALRFITFDPGSPWYMRGDAPGDIADKVIFGLAKVHDEMLPHIQNFAQRIEVP